MQVYWRQMCCGRLEDWEWGRAPRSRADLEHWLDVAHLVQRFGRGLSKAVRAHLSGTHFLFRVLFLGSPAGSVRMAEQD